MSSAPTFPKQDPATPAFWDLRFKADFTPWDQGGVPDYLVRHVEAHPAPSRVLIPGCGAGHEIRYFAERSWPVMAIDFSKVAVARAKAQLGSLGHLVHEADFFGASLEPGRFDVIYERAFLCALPRSLWRDWARRVAELLPPGGQLFGFFYVDTLEKGPPFGLGDSQLSDLLEANFQLREELTPTDSIPIFRGKEKWMVWERRA
jgi:SAM-dependent methyltransferase